MAGRGYSSVSTAEDKSDPSWRHPNARDDLELLETQFLHHGSISEESLLDKLKVESFTCLCPSIV